MGQELNVMKFKLNQPALIEASAGTGKTYTITNLVLRILLGSGDCTNSLDRPLLIDDLLIVTFTNAATADLKRRIYERIRYAHVLFENFLELAGQELSAKLKKQIKQKFKGIKEGSKAWDKAVRELGLEHEEFSLVKLDDDEFCQHFLTDERLLPKLSTRLAQYEINIEALVKKRLNCHDEFLIQLLKQMASQNVLREAIRVLIQAERSIDNAAICTIHSFCNRTLNQIYAFEANEAFTSELAADLSYEDDQAAHAVWRQQFYKLHISPSVLRLLGIVNPSDLSEIRRAINAVRLSQEQDGIYGYQLINLQIPGLKNFVDLSHDYSTAELFERLALQAEILDYAQTVLIYQAFTEWSKQAEWTLIDACLDLENKTLGPNFSGGKVPAVLKGGQRFIDGLAMFKQVQTQIAEASSSLGHNLASSSLELPLSSQLASALDKFRELIRYSGILGNAVLSNTNSTTQGTQATDSSLKSEQSALHGGVLDLPKLQQLMQALKATGAVEMLGKLQEQILEAKSSVVSSDFLKPNTSFFVRSNGKFATMPWYEELTEQAKELVKLVQAPSAKIRALKPALYTLLGMLINQQLQKQCEEHHLMSNDDLLLRLDQALHREDFGERLAQLIRIRYPIAMIDEFQDTDPIQYSIFSTIYLNREALQEKSYCYLIGDPKQSIYAFRGSDINSYLKARNTIKDLTLSKGLSTLPKNYRSDEDVIMANNALFGMVLNPDNVLPFKERDIPFKAVEVSKKRYDQPQLTNKVSLETLRSLTADKHEIARAWGSSFVLENLVESSLLLYPELYPTEAIKPKLKAELRVEALDGENSVQVADSKAAQEMLGAIATGQEADIDSVSNSVLVSDTQSTATAQATYDHNAPAVLMFDENTQLPKAFASTYAVMFHEGCDSIGAAREAYAQAAAYLIKQILEHGKLVGSNTERPVNPSDIAILVRRASESDLMQSALQKLGISSVYFSDHSSVLLDENGSPTAESLYMLYLMEAMCDYSNRAKVMRVIGSGLLSLHTDEFLECTADQRFEREVLILRDCAEIWNKYGFMPAFIKWCNAPEHQVTARLLSIINGERCLTNCNQISELIQSAHNRYSGIQAQVRWFYDTLYSDQVSFDADATQKRLESEHEQIKILTIHKSKGLEFPVVFMPFLWAPVFKPLPQKNMIETAKYYDPQVEHMVLDYDMEHKISIKDEVVLAKKRLAAALAKQASLSGQLSELSELPELSELSELSAHSEQIETMESFKGASDSVKAQVQVDVVKSPSTALKAKHSSALKAKSSSAQTTSEQTKEESENKVLSPKDFADYEDGKEQTRLLYVAITRARSANFFFIAQMNLKKSSGKASALMDLLGVKNINDCSKAEAALKQHPELFTLLDGDKCLQLYAAATQPNQDTNHGVTLASAAPDHRSQAEKLKQRMMELIDPAISEGWQWFEQDQGQWSYLDRFGQRRVKERAPYAMFHGVPMERRKLQQILNLEAELQLVQSNNLPLGVNAACAMSFVYKGAVDRSFNIMSYSKLTSNHDPVKQALDGQKYHARRNEDEDGAVDVAGYASMDPDVLNISNLQSQQYSSEWLGNLNETGVGTLVGGSLYTGNIEIKQAQQQRQAWMYRLQDPALALETTSVNLMQIMWDAGYFLSRNTCSERLSQFNFEFLRGAEPGTFLHEVLRLIDFSQLQKPEIKLEELLRIDLESEVKLRNDLLPIYYKTKLDQSFGRLTDWMIDVLEAPILKGNNQCLALADLQERSFVHEMNFLMTSRRFNTQDIDQLCQEIAYKLIPQQLQSQIDITQLTLNPDELFGFITGSLDLACRFDLDYTGSLQYRENLCNNLSLPVRDAFYAEAQRQGFNTEPVSNPNPNYKYYVIDYKSNVLGEKYEDYSTNNMLLAIYEHRYDVQFLFYTLALYRFLKRRKGVEFDADYATLERFYNENVGGVIYMFLRGLRADFLRRKVSTGVFSARIDFEFVYRLDQIFGAEQQWEA